MFYFNPIIIIGGKYVYLLASYTGLPEIMLLN